MGMPPPLNVKIDMAPMLGAVEQLLSGGEDLAPDLAANVRREIGAVMRVAQVDAMAPREFYEHFGANVFVLLARRVYSEKIAADLLARLKRD